MFIQFKLMVNVVSVEQVLVLIYLQTLLSMILFSLFLLMGDEDRAEAVI
jgi:hypothetical protein